MSVPPSPSRALMVLTPAPTVYGDDTEWQAILHSSNQVVLYNPRSHALSISHSANLPMLCPYCKQALPLGFDPGTLSAHSQLSAHNYDRERGNTEEELEEQIESLSTDPAYHSRASDYFQLLEMANDASSRPSTPPLVGGNSSATRYQGSRSRSRSRSRTRGSTRAFPANAMAEGYFNSFFQEEYKLGMGANGSVFLCQVRFMWWFWF